MINVIIFVRLVSDYMNRKGFSLIELLATIVVLGIIAGIVLITTSDTFTEAKGKTQEAFINTIKDAMDVYLSDPKVKKKTFAQEVCEIHKTHGIVKVYKNTETLTFKDVINSDYKPLTESDLINPANKEVKCNSQARIYIYRDDDYVFYYKINPADFDCLLGEVDMITDLPSDCQG